MLKPQIMTDSKTKKQSDNTCHEMTLKRTKTCHESKSVVFIGCQDTVVWLQGMPGDLPQQQILMSVRVFHLKADQHTHTHTVHQTPYRIRATLECTVSSYLLLLSLN